jgi:hypothetical protein
VDETPPTPSSPSDRDIEEILNRRRRALADLMHSPVMAEGDMLDAVHQITETAALLLNVERASVWRLADQGAAIECIDLYERGPARHSSGTRIVATEVPRYFEALQRERAIRADDARADPRTSEFRRGYLEPLGITAMLDAPIFVRGAMVGVVCHEHSGTARRWSFAEELLAGTFADFVALVLETSSWHQAERALRVERDALESKVEERTRELRDSEANMRAMLELSPISMVLTRISDHTIVFANRRAAEMFRRPIASGSCRGCFATGASMIWRRSCVRPAAAASGRGYRGSACVSPERTPSSGPWSTSPSRSRPRTGCATSPPAMS